MSTATLGLSLAGNFELGTAIWAGLVGAIAMLVVTGSIYVAVAG